MKCVQKVLLFFFHLIEWCMIAAAGTLLGLMLFGIHPYIVKTGSMEPTIATGSICFVNQHVPFENVHEGDIIIFKIENMIVAHRVVQIGQDGITTKGDANNIQDAVKITDKNYIGKTIFWFPYIGRFIMFSFTRKGKILLVNTLVVFIFAGFLENKFKNENDRNKQEE